MVKRSVKQGEYRKLKWREIEVHKCFNCMVDKDAQRRIAGSVGASSFPSHRCDWIERG